MRVEALQGDSVTPGCSGGEAGLGGRANHTARAGADRAAEQVSACRQDAWQALSCLQGGFQQLVLMWTRAGAGRTGGRAGDLEAAA